MGVVTVYVAGDARSLLIRFISEVNKERLYAQDVDLKWYESAVKVQDRIIEVAFPCINRNDDTGMLSFPCPSKDVESDSKHSQRIHGQAGQPCILDALQPTALLEKLYMCSRTWSGAPPVPEKKEECKACSFLNAHSLVQQPQQSLLMVSSDLLASVDGIMGMLSVADLCQLGNCSRSYYFVGHSTVVWKARCESLVREELDRRLKAEGPKPPPCEEQRNKVAERVCAEIRNSVSFRSWRLEYRNMLQGLFAPLEAYLDSATHSLFSRDVDKSGLALQRWIGAKCGTRILSHMTAAELATFYTTHLYDVNCISHTCDLLSDDPAAYRSNIVDDYEASWARSFKAFVAFCVRRGYGMQCTSG